MVVECILNDPRVDHQVENRGWFYASLLVRLGVDLTLLRAVYEQPVDPSGDDAAWLTVDVLAQAAEQGVLGAVSELRRYLRSGRDFELGFRELVRFTDHPEAAGLLEEALKMADDEALERALTGFNDFTARPWPQWRAASAALTELCEASWTRGRRRTRSRRSRPISSSTDAREEPPHPDRSRGYPRHAIAGLARLTDPSQDDLLLDLAPTCSSMRRSLPERSGPCADSCCS